MILIEEYQKEMALLGIETLATPCGLYCGFCRYFTNNKCLGCGSADRKNCEIFTCCKKDKTLLFCTECNDFPCEILSNSVGLHPDWLNELAKLPIKRFSKGRN